MKNYDNHSFRAFRNLYSINKTLRFELRPTDNTQRHFSLDQTDQNPLLKMEYARSDAYTEVKELMNNYHAWFISHCLQSFRFNQDILSEWYELFKKHQNTKPEQDRIKAIQKILRQDVVACFNSKAYPENKAIFDQLFNKKIFNLMVEACESNILIIDPEEWPKKKAAIKEFSKFSGYFKGFHDNRKNMYKPEEAATSIAYRIVHDNLPLFFRNMRQFCVIQEKDPNLIHEFCKDGEEWHRIHTWLKDRNRSQSVHTLGDLFSLNQAHIMVHQEGIDYYNCMLGGVKNHDGETSIEGLNQKINQSSHLPKSKTGRPMTRLVSLKKQILGEPILQSKSLPVSFKSDDEVYHAIRSFHADTQNLFVIVSNTIRQLFESSFDLTGIFIKNDQELTQLSVRWLGEWESIKQCYIDYHTKDLKKVTTKAIEKYETLWKRQSHISVYDLQVWVNHVYNKENTPLFDYLKQAIHVQKRNQSIQDALSHLNNQYNALDSAMRASSNLKNDDQLKQAIKSYFDTALAIRKFANLFNLPKDQPHVDMAFYGEFNPALEKINQWFYDVYNATRNYVTKKPYSLDKIKVSFQSPTFLNGWDENKEKENCGIILIRDGRYYLAIRNKEDKRSKHFLSNAPLSDAPDAYQKMVYQYLPGPNKMLPKVFFPKKNPDLYNPSDRIKAIYKNQTFKKGDRFNLADCHALIDFFKGAIDQHDRWKTFNFRFSPTESYSDIGVFYKDIAQQGYHVHTKGISADYVDQMDQEGSIYMFELYSKDFSRKSKGTPNLHTLYWHSLFDPRNKQVCCMKLDGEAEMFFRETSIQHPTVHKKNVEINRKHLDHTSEKSIFPYDIIKDKRFTKNKCFLHVPVSVNFQARGLRSAEINEWAKTHIQQCVKQKKDLTILGIDRGENNLLYYSLINLDGHIIKQDSLNVINNTDYLSILKNREGDQDAAQKNWANINNIKELKSGYLSHAIHKITQTMIEHNSMIVLEDLNMGFKRTRQKVGRQVYQKFEKMLIEKLNFYVDKTAATSDITQIYKAFQLSTEFESFKKLSKQSGFVFYVPPSYTSIIDPTTGFAPLATFNTKGVVEKLKESLDSIQDARLIGDAFEWTIDFSMLSPMCPYTFTLVIQDGVGRHVYHPRSQKNRESKTSVRYLFTELHALFKDHGISFSQNESLVSACRGQHKKKFFEGLYGILNCAMKLRYKNYDSHDPIQNDYILSPIRNRLGHCFDSRNAASTSWFDRSWDGDANGAYHIALKGLSLARQLGEVGNKGKLVINQKAWIQFAQQFATQTMGE